MIAQFLKMKYGIPYVWTNHIDAIPQPKVFKCMYKLFHFPIISVSSDLKNYMISKFKISEKNITVICNGVNQEEYKQLNYLEEVKCKQ